MNGECAESSSRSRGSERLFGLTASTREVSVCLSGAAVTQTSQRDDSRNRPSVWIDGFHTQTSPSHRHHHHRTNKTPSPDVEGRTEGGEAGEAVVAGR